MNLNLENKNALVCGSSKGIGKAIAEGIANLGGNVTLVARRKEVLESVRNNLAQNGNQAHHILVADFSQPEELKEKINKLCKEKDFHILVNNTGGPPGGPASKAGIDEFVEAFKRHLICNQVLSQALIPGMKKMGYGRIINVISTSVKQPLPNLGVSNTIRGAVANWSKTLANELGNFGITVNNILPGATNTDRLKEIIENKAKKLGKSEEEVAKGMQHIIPLKRFAQPEEVANAAVFLASPAAAYINGINLPVDGGRTACL